MSTPENDRIESLSRRLAQIEAFLRQHGFQPGDLPRDLSPTALPQAQPSSAEPAEPASGSLIPRVHQALEPARSPDPVRDEQGIDIPISLSTPVPMAEIASAPASKAMAFERASAARPVPPPLPRRGIDYVPRVPGSPHPATTFATRGMEQAIGLKLAGWIGAIVLVIGAALGIKYGYDQGWLGGMPAEIKLGVLYAIGIGLIGVGEWVYRKVNPLASVGLYAAGIAGLFVVSYAGNSYYQLYGQQIAFGLMAGACAIGAMISLRGGLVSIAILSLLGANLAPLILRDSSVGEVPLLVYLLALQLMAIGLAHVGKGARWWILRNFALVSLSLWMAGRLTFSATAFSVPTLVFLCLYALLFQVENAAAAWRRGDRSFSYPTFSFAVTAAFTLALLRWSMPFTDMQRGATMVGLSMIAFTIGAATVSAKLENMRALAHGWIVQGGVLLFAAVPVALAGPWIVIAWAMMALGYAIIGVVLKRGRTAVGGVIVWCSALLYFGGRLLLDNGSNPLRDTLFTVKQHPIPVYLAVGLVLAAIGQALALLLASRRLLREGNRVNETAITLGKGVAVIAAILAATILVAGLPPLAATWAWVALAWGLLAIARSSNSISDVYRALAALAITLAMAKWVAIDVIGGRLAETHDLATPRLLFNSTMAVGLATVVSLWLIAKSLNRSAPATTAAQADLTNAAIVLGVASLSTGLSFELYAAVQRLSASSSTMIWPPMQLTQFGWTLLWSIAAISIPWIGRTMRVSIASLAQLKTFTAAALVLVSVKFLVIDALSYAFGDRVGATPIVNAETLTAIILLGLLVYCVRSSGHAMARQICRAAIFVLPLVIGSIELDRLFGPRRTLVAFSLFWGVYSIASIAIGFVVRSSILRFAGLGLLGITLLKIVLVDLASAGTGWRILSFLGVGAILLATSVLYGRLSPKLLSRSSPDEID